MRDKSLIEAVILDYFQGTYRANAEQICSAFAPSARIRGFASGGYIDLSRDEFIAHVCDHVRHDSYDKKICHMDIYENIATVKAKVLVGNVYFIDFIQLIKVDDQWAIQHKLFNQVPVV